MKLPIEKVVYGGQGLARIPLDAGPRGGMRAFIPYVLPGELVEAEIAEEHRGYCVARAASIENESESRAVPPCPWFGTCGGCQLQHATYPYQLQLKREMLVESLQRAGVGALPAIEILAGPPLGYRNRIRLHVRHNPEFAIGYRKEKSHKLAAVEGCPIAARRLEQCIAALRKLGAKRQCLAGIAELEMFTNHDQSEVLMTAWAYHFAEGDAEAYTGFFAALQAEIPEVRGAQVVVSDKKSERNVRPALQWGEQKLRYHVAGHDYIVGADSFFQVNSTLLDEFVAHVTEGSEGELAWDLYAGVGLFSAVLGERFSHLIAVESSAVAHRDLRTNLRGRVEAVRSTTLEFLRSASRSIARGRKPSPDMVILDPPRAGAGADACRLLALCNPRRIVYVSCDPATLGRDLAVLIQSGYRLDRLQFVDMFPQTYHLETIARLSH